MKTLSLTAVIIAVLISTIALVNVAIAEIVTKTVFLDGVKKIRLLGDHELYFTQGDDEFVKVTATRELLPKIVAEIRGDTLTLKTKNSVWSLFDFDSHARFDVQLKDIRSLDLSGSGYVELGDISSDDLSIKQNGSGDLVFAQITAHRVFIDVSGSGDVKGASLEAGDLDLHMSGSAEIQLQQAVVENDIDTAISGSGTIGVDNLTADELAVDIAGSGKFVVNKQGTVRRQKVNIAGSGDYLTTPMISHTARLNIAGSGNADIHVTDKLSVDLWGSSDVNVSGNPTIDSNIAGSGDIHLTPSH